MNGLIAFAIVGFIALGCACPKDSNTSSTSNSSSDNPFGSSNQSDTTTTRAGETKPDASKGAMPTEGELQYLVRDTMLSFNDAIQSADFSSFYSDISKQWQKQTNAEELETQFQSFIEGKANFGEIKDMTAEIKSKSTRKQSGYNVLDVKGEYPTKPIATTFDLSYVAEGSDWRLFKVQVYTGVRTK
jgi:hypothetical protein